MSSERPAKDSTHTLDRTQESEPTQASSDGASQQSKTEQKEVTRRTRPSAVIVHETVREEGEQELQRTPVALAWSGLAAGLSMGFSLIAQVADEVSGNK